MGNYIVKKRMKLYLLNEKIYRLNIELLIDAIEKKRKISTASLSTWMELYSNDLKSKKRTAARVNNVIHGGDESIGINTIRLLGLCLLDNEMAFLEEIKLDDISEVLEKKKYESDMSNVKKIYTNIYNVLYEIVDSNHFNYIPNTQIDGFKYYEKKVDEIRRNICIDFFNDVKIRNILIRIIDEVEEFIKSYSIPGVCKRWKEINKPITNFDIVYDFYYKYPELFSKICNGKISDGNKKKIMFDFIPTYKDIKNRELYFYSLNERNKNMNLHYSYETIFRNEVLNTLTKVFEHDFKEIGGI